ncbi:MAG TPA: UMP kinase, partial [Desulfotomaculum sp.]|nr:UMP kinase [Desulfotomaculum sp.]
MLEKPRYKRVILKISGEALAGCKEYGVDPRIVNSIAAQVEEVAGLGVQLGIVV